MDIVIMKEKQKSNEEIIVMKTIIYVQNNYSRLSRVEDTIEIYSQTLKLFR